MSKKLKKSKQQSIYLDSEVIESIEQKAFEDGRTKSGLINRLLRVALGLTKTKEDNKD